MTDYAVVKHGGKQYRVSPGDVLLVERTVPDLSAGDELRFDRVMMLSQGEKVSIGTPTVEGASVLSQVVELERGKKVIIFKKKRRKGFLKKTGHRQPLTEVRIKEISL